MEAFMKHYNLLSLFDDFDRGFFGTPTGHAGVKKHWTPSSFVDVQENGYLLSLDLPGVDSEHLKVDLGDKEITITGERSDQRARRNGESEEFFKFTSRFTLPDDINEDEVDVALENGVLEISLPKISRKSQPRTLTIRKGNL